MSKLLSNLPIEKLTSENDYIGIIEKGDLIKSFFLANKQEFSELKFFTIYGDWGSGKSTLMKYLQKELKNSFNPFFFEAWQYESDSNLANSLLEFLAKKSETKIDNFLKNGSKLLEGFAKSITFKTPIANFSAEKILNEVDDSPTTFFELKEQFKKDFESWENDLTNKDKSPDYNIVFIDDLDRCEPENVLKLLSAIKLFFTFGKKTIFFCGIDKKAVTEAVKTKYGEVVKANEYLEKVFDISFTMPQTYNIFKLVNFYFNKEYSDVHGNKVDLSSEITTFFKELHFTNPRRIKKILNKYLLIQNLLKNKEVKTSVKLPNIITENSGTLFETYLTLYLLILKEFENDIFDSFLNLPFLRIKVEQALEERNSKNNNVSSYHFNIDEDLIKEKFINYKRGINYDLFSLFIPINVNAMSDSILMEIEIFDAEFNVSKKKYDYFFIRYLILNKDIITKDLKKSDYSLLDYKNMIANLI